MIQLKSKNNSRVGVFATPTFLLKEKKKKKERKKEKEEKDSELIITMEERVSSSFATRFTFAVLNRSGRRSISLSF